MNHSCNFYTLAIVRPSCLIGSKKFSWKSPSPFLLCSEMTELQAMFPKPCLLRTNVQGRPFENKVCSNDKLHLFLSIWMMHSAVEDSSVFKIRICRTGLRAEDGEKSPSVSGCHCILPLLACCVYSIVSVMWGFRFFQLESKFHPGYSHTQWLLVFLLAQYLGKCMVEHVHISPFSLLLQAQILSF